MGKGFPGKEYKRGKTWWPACERPASNEMGSPTFSNGQSPWLLTPMIPLLILYIAFCLTCVVCSAVSYGLATQKGQQR